MSGQGLPGRAGVASAAAAERAWQVARRDGTGLFVVGPSGNLLFRIDLATQTIFPWDKRLGREVPIRLSDLAVVQP